MSPKINKIEGYARDCMTLAEQLDTPPDLRDQLHGLAREMFASIQNESVALIGQYVSWWPVPCCDGTSIPSARAKMLT